MLQGLLPMLGWIMDDLRSDPIQTLANPRLDLCPHLDPT